MVRRRRRHSCIAPAPEVGIGKQEELQTERKEEKMDESVQRGKIKRWFAHAGYGFISREAGGDLFSHVSSHCGHLKEMTKLGADLAETLIYFTEVISTRGPKTEVVCCKQCYLAATDLAIDNALRESTASSVSDRMRALFEPGVRLDLGGNHPYVYRFDKEKPAADHVLKAFEDTAMRAVFDGLPDSEVITQGTCAASALLKKLFPRTTTNGGQR
jgi:hypothetical protein